MFELEKDIEIPEKRKKKSTGKAGQPPIYPFRKMSIGDSFYVPPKLAKKAQGAANVFAHRNPDYKLKTRFQECGGIRIWRVE